MICDLKLVILAVVALVAFVQGQDPTASAPADAGAITTPAPPTTTTSPPSGGASPAAGPPAGEQGSKAQIDIWKMEYKKCNMICL